MGLEKVEIDVKCCQYCGVKPFISTIDDEFKCYECPKCHRRGSILHFNEDSDNEIAKERMKEWWNLRNKGCKQ